MLVKLYIFSPSGTQIKMIVGKVLRQGLAWSIEIHYRYPLEATEMAAKYLHNKKMCF